jgi:YggT family protein
VICTLLSIYSFLLFVRLLLSWFPNPPEWARPIYVFLYAITDPLLRLVRPLVPPLRMGMMALDLSPIIIFIAITILIRILQSQGVC